MISSHTKSRASVGLITSSTRAGDSSRELLSVQLFQDIWFDSESGNDLERNFYAGAALQPAHWLRLRGQAKIDLDRGETVRNSISASIKDGRINELELAYFNYRSFSDQWQFASHRISERKALHGALRIQGDRPKIPLLAIDPRIQTDKVMGLVLHPCGKKRYGKGKRNRSNCKHTPFFLLTVKKI